MSEAMFSPSPWVYAPEGDVDGDPAVDHLARYGVDHHVVSESGAEIACAPSESDARLISAAPDLFKALTACFDAMNQHGACYVGAGQIWNDALFAADAALAKARGETTEE